MNLDGLMATKGLTPDEIRALPAAVPIPEAGQCFGLGKSTSYELARSGKFPVPVLPLGKGFRATRASILAKLGIEDKPAASDDQVAQDAADHASAA
jgi:predicted DNA-binding transcriptional regulator AlpA